MRPMRRKRKRRKPFSSLCRGKGLEALASAEVEGFLVIPADDQETEDQWVERCTRRSQVAVLVIEHAYAWEIAFEVPPGAQPRTEDLAVIDAIFSRFDGGFTAPCEGYCSVRDEADGPMAIAIARFLATLLGTEAVQRKGAGRNG